MVHNELRDRLTAAALLTGQTPEWTHLTATIVQALEEMDRLHKEVRYLRSTLSDIETRANQGLEQ